MYNIESNDFKLAIIYLLILVFILIICKNISNTLIEGMIGPSDITKITNTVDNIATKATSIPEKITGLATTITGAASGIADTIDTKIGQVETKLTNAANTAIDTAIKPVNATIDTVRTGITTAVDKVETKIMNKVNLIKTAVEKIEGKIEWLLGQIANLPELIQGIVKIAIAGFKTEVIDPIKDGVSEIKSTMRMVIRFITHLPGKIIQFGENIGELLKGGIVSPFMTLFEAMGHMFVMIGAIAMKVINKITTLPNCSGLYMFKSVYATVKATVNGIFYILPDFVTAIISPIFDVLSTIYDYTLKIPLEYILNYIIWFLELDVWWDKCFDFNVDEETNSIVVKFNEVGPAFRDTFGKMDFKDLIDFSDNPKQDKKLREAKEKEDELMKQELAEQG